jgi:sugar phosphate isomerase/epimerase
LNTYYVCITTKKVLQYSVRTTPINGGGMTENPDLKLLKIMEQINRIFDERGLEVPGIAGYSRKSYHKNAGGLGAHGTLSDGTIELKRFARKKISIIETDYGPVEQDEATYIILYKRMDGGLASIKHIQVVDPLRFNWEGFLWDLGVLLGGEITRPEDL